MTENKLFKIVNDCGDYHLMNGDEILCYDLCSPSMREENWNNVVNKLNELSEENEKLKKYNKGQELEIIRLHTLADAMSAVLRELGIYDVYNDEQIENVKRRIIND